jgi:hypothetical protein
LLKQVGVGHVTSEVRLKCAWEARKGMPKLVSWVTSGLYRDEFDA